MRDKQPERIDADLEWPPRPTGALPPEEFQNPPGAGGETCDAEPDATDMEPCDPSAAEDLVLEESKPGIGIEGYEGEEVGGA